MTDRWPLLGLLIGSCLLANCQRQLPVVDAEPDTTHPAAGASAAAGSGGSPVRNGSSGSTAATAASAGSTGRSMAATGSSGSTGNTPTASANGTSDLDNAFRLPSGICSAPAAEVLGATGLDIRTLTLANDTLVIGTSSSIVTMAKAGNVSPTMLSDDAAYALAALGDVVYYSDAVFLGAASLPGKMGQALTSSSDDIQSDNMVSDATALYVSGSSSKCSDSVQVFGLDGTKRTIKADCPLSIATSAGTAYIISSKDGAKGLFKAGPNDTAFQPLLMEKRLDDSVPITVTASYVYFSISEAIPNSYLARVPIGGGKLEVLGGPGFFDNMISDGKVVYFYSSANAICTFGYVEQSGTFEQIASYGVPSALDDQYVYLRAGKDGVARIPR
jgi:hypothetical protein